MVPSEFPESFQQRWNEMLSSCIILMCYYDKIKYRVCFDM